jgi:hypothetical protein
VLLHFPSLSSRTFVYKGMLTPGQLATYYSDLADPRLTSAMALVQDAAARQQTYLNALRAQSGLRSTS